MTNESPERALVRALAACDPRYVDGADPYDISHRCALCQARHRDRDGIEHAAWCAYRTARGLVAAWDKDAAAASAVRGLGDLGSLTSDEWRNLVAACRAPGRTYRALSGLTFLRQRVDSHDVDATDRHGGRWRVAVRDVWEHEAKLATINRSFAMGTTAALPATPTDHRAASAKGSHAMFTDELANMLAARHDLAIEFVRVILADVARHVTITLAEETPDAVARRAAYLGDVADAKRHRATVEASQERVAAALERAATAAERARASEDPERVRAEAIEASAAHCDRSAQMSRTSETEARAAHLDGLAAECAKRAEFAEELARRIRRGGTTTADARPIADDAARLAEAKRIARVECAEACARRARMERDVAREERAQGHYDVATLSLGRAVLAECLADEFRAEKGA